MASLYLTIKLQGLGWGHKRPSEKDYKKIARKLARIISEDDDFLPSPSTTVSIQIRGYNPIVKSVLVKEPIESDVEIAFEEISPTD